MKANDAEIRERLEATPVVYLVRWYRADLQALLDDKVELVTRERKMVGMMREVLNRGLFDDFPGLRDQAQALLKEK